MILLFLFELFGISGTIFQADTNNLPFKKGDCVSFFLPNEKPCYISLPNVLPVRGSRPVVTGPDPIKGQPEINIIGQELKERNDAGSLGCINLVSATKSLLSILKL